MVLAPLDLAFARRARRVGDGQADAALGLQHRVHEAGLAGPRGRHHDEEIAGHLFRAPDGATVYSMFWTCSRICSMRTFSSTEMRVMSAETDLRPEGVGLAVQLLAEEVQALAAGAALVEHAPELRHVGAQALELLVHVDARGVEHDLLLDALVGGRGARPPRGARRACRGRPSSPPASAAAPAPRARPSTPGARAAPARACRPRAGASASARATACAASFATSSRIWSGATCASASTPGQCSTSETVSAPRLRERRGDAAPRPARARPSPSSSGDERALAGRGRREGEAAIDLAAREARRRPPREAPARGRAGPRPGGTGTRGSGG